MSAIHVIEDSHSAAVVRPDDAGTFEDGSIVAGARSTRSLKVQVMTYTADTTTITSLDLRFTPYLRPSRMCDRKQGRCSAKKFRLR